MLHLYEYAIIRLVPRVEREEFMNVGVIVFCKKSGFLECRFELNEKRIACLFPEADIDLVRTHLKAFEAIANGQSVNSPIAKLPAPERFRWLTATRSTMIQCSKVHPGITPAESDALDNLMELYVR